MAKNKEFYQNMESKLEEANILKTLKISNRNFPYDLIAQNRIVITIPNVPSGCHAKL